MQLEKNTHENLSKVCTKCQSISHRQRNEMPGYELLTENRLHNGYFVDQVY